MESTKYIKFPDIYVTVPVVTDKAFYITFYVAHYSNFMFIIHYICPHFLRNCHTISTDTGTGSDSEVPMCGN